MLKIDKIYTIDSLEGLRQLPDECIQCCVTSPPYFRQRDYQVKGQYGMEETPEQYIAKMVEVFMEVHRVLKKDGVLWLNIGDAYWGSGKSGKNPEYRKRHKEFGKASSRGMQLGTPTTGKHQLLKPKDLIGLPWMLAFALREKGWWLRQDIIWQKMNCMPESVTDRCTRSHEYIFMLTKLQNYYYDAEAIKTRIKASTLVRMQNAVSGKHKYNKGVPGHSRIQGIFKPREKKQDKLSPTYVGFNERWSRAFTESKKVNKRSVWTINTKPLKENHFAAYPSQIPELCIKAGSREGDIILDPFMGAGTTALAAKLHDRHFIGFELNKEYVRIANKRLYKQFGLFYQYE